MSQIGQTTLEITDIYSLYFAFGDWVETDTFGPCLEVSRRMDEVVLLEALSSNGDEMECAEA